VLEELRRESEKRLQEKIKDMSDPVLLEKEEYEEQKRFFGNMDRYLDNTQEGPHWLKNTAVAQIIAEAMHHRHGKVYDLDVFSILSNHVHVLFTPVEKEDGGYHSLSSIMHSLKLFTAIRGNRVLNRKGAFWHHESYDHFVRDEEELKRIRRYIVQNPVKAGLVEDWEAWPWSFARWSVEP
jgi:REP element-mobilizing transposase RayT